MQGCVPRFSVGCLLCSLLAVNLTVAAVEIPQTWIDDALLHDVQFVGSQYVIAVGEHGAVWKSVDGGRHWSMSDCGMDVSLQSVCFLTDRIGWIAGKESTAYSSIDSGILLATQDGGQTWQRIVRDGLPSLNYVKFFGMDDGIVVGQGNAVSPTGIFKTSDGGKSWRGVQGEATHRWKAACFLEPELGIVAGINGRVSLMGGEQLFPSKLQPQGVRSIRGISLLSNNTGWLAGDGGLVLKTATGGVVWESPPKSLPDELREGIDFRAVEVRADKVWLAGTPGSVVWHSPDGGTRWEKQWTGQTAPISAIRFSNERQGVAVGAFGTILHTDDGGKSWHAAHGDGRHAAVLSIHARPGKTSPPTLTKLSGEMGYRSAVWIAQRDDLGPLAWSTETETILQAAIQHSGSHNADVYWQLPLTVPGLEYSSERLLAQWQKQTEGRLPQTLMGAIVRQIRTWRPNLVILDQPSSDDAAGQLLFDATLRAVGQAADATRYVEQSELTGLEKWKVDRVYVRLAAGATGDAHIDLDEFLPYFKTSTRIASSPSITMLQSGRIPVSETVESTRIAYRWIGLDGKPADERAPPRSDLGSNSPLRAPIVGERVPNARASASRDFFASLMISPGSPARRELPPLDETNLDRMQKLVQKHRNFTSLFQKSLDNPQVAGQMIAQIPGIVEGMEPQQAVGILRDLADEYRKQSQFELVESTYVELIRRYPKEPGALDAMRWLIQFWSSGETAWQRTRVMNAGTAVTQSDPKSQAQRIQQASAKSNSSQQAVQPAVDVSGGSDLMTSGAAGSPTRLTTKLDFDGTHSPNQKGTKHGRLKISRDVDWRTGAIGEWHSRASELAKQIQTTSPMLFQSPEIQFPLAALRRTDGSARIADSIMRSIVTNPVNLETKQLAERELWASFATAESPTALSFCRQATDRPHLDGLLSDPCWVDAKEIRLSENPHFGGQAFESAEIPRSMVMFAYDHEFLYVAISAPRSTATPLELPQSTGRHHDADLSRQDRFSIRLDIDRDYATWYEFQVDQRGWTSESCWEDRRWDPTWYVAAEGDQTDWRIEAAIPWSELTPSPPQRGTIYAVSILRTIPNVGLESWTQPATTRPQPTSFGLLKFQ